MAALDWFLLTTGANEIPSGNGWTRSGPICYAPTNQYPGVVPLNRYADPTVPGRHFFSTSTKFENGHLPNPPWVLEGVAFQVFRQSQPGTDPIMRWVSTANPLDHVWVIGATGDSLLPQLGPSGFTLEGPDGYVFVTPNVTNTQPVYRFSLDFKRCFSAYTAVPNPDYDPINNPEEPPTINEMVGTPENVTTNGLDQSVAAAAYAGSVGGTNYQVSNGDCG